MSLQEIFIANLKYYRKQKKLTQNELTIALDKSYNYINGIEQGKSFPSIDTIEKICEILGVRAAELFDEKACPQNIKASFRKKYGQSLQDMLTRRLVRDIEEIFRLL